MRREIICNHCGCEVQERKGRSPRHHRFLFKAISEATNAWPLQHYFRPNDSEHLRAWLLKEAGAADVVTEDRGRLAEDPAALLDYTALISQMTRERGYGFFDIIGTMIYAKFPRSISWQAMDEEEFKPVAKKIFEIIEAEVGVPVDVLVREHEAAA